MEAVDIEIKMNIEIKISLWSFLLDLENNDVLLIIKHTLLRKLMKIVCLFLNELIRLMNLLY